MSTPAEQILARMLQMEEAEDVTYDLDEIVHDTASAIASDVNNSGTRRQLEWLIEKGIDVDYIAEYIGLVADEERLRVAGVPEHDEENA